MLKLALVAAALLLQAASQSASLGVRVVDLATNRPVPRARLVLAQVGAGAVSDYRTGVADGNGRFGFTALPPGSYRIFAERQGYLRAEYGRRAPNVAGTAISLIPGQSLSDVTITMIPTGIIAGRVLDEGQPARGVWVRAMQASFFDGDRSLRIVEYARTDDLGEYRLFGLAPGIYYVSALPFDRPRIEGDTYVVPAIPSMANNNRSQTRTPVVEALAKDLVEPEAFGRDIYLPLFYPGTTDAIRAAPLDLQPGATLTGIDLTIARSAAVRLRGRVIDATTGRPAQNVSVTVAPQEGRTFDIAGTTVDASGAFELAAVPPGRYDLIARTTTAGVRLFGTAPVEVPDRDLAGVDIVIRPGATLTGRAIVTGAGSDMGRSVVGASLAGVAVQLMGVGGMPGYGATRIQADGTFIIENVEAREYRVRLTTPRGFRAPESVRFGGEDVTGRTFRFGSDMASAPLEVTVSLAVGGLDVIVLDAGRPFHGATVALVPEPPRRSQSSLYRTASTDESGRARFDDVVPGDYKLFTADVDPATWQDPDVVRRYENSGTRVRVIENAREAVTVRER